jgi:hypothetical protein
MHLNINNSYPLRHPALLLQAPALRALSPAEREVLLLLGSDIAANQGQLLIQENDKVGVWAAMLQRTGQRFPVTKMCRVYVHCNSPAVDCFSDACHNH